MSEEIIKNGQNESKSRKKKLNQKLDGMIWGLFFIWVGIVFLLDFSWSIGLIGIGIIILGEQVVRGHFKLKTQGFWITVGLLLVAGGFWRLCDVEISLFPIVLIVIGVVPEKKIKRIKASNQNLQEMLVMNGT